MLSMGPLLALAPALSPPAPNPRNKCTCICLLKYALTDTIHRLREEANTPWHQTKDCRISYQTEGQK